MITPILIEEVRAIGNEMARLHADYHHEVNAEETAAHLKKLADLAEEKSEYHSQIFQKCNVIRSLACCLAKSSDHKSAIAKLKDPIAALQNWDPPERECTGSE